MLSEIAILYENATEEYKERLSKAENDLQSQVNSKFPSELQPQNMQDRLKRQRRSTHFRLAASIQRLQKSKTILETQKKEFTQTLAFRLDENRQLMEKVKRNQL
jgi:hypothetical protein